MRLRLLWLVLALSAALNGQCTQSFGLTLAEHGIRLGDPFSIDLAGTPNVVGLLGVDVAPGSVATPIGTVCLGFTASMQLLPFTLDATGHYSLHGMLPPQPSLIGLGAFLQAAAIDPTQPTGSALSNGVSFTLRSPRVFYVGNIYAGYAAVGCQWMVYDAITDAPLLGPVVLPFVMRGVAIVPYLNWIAFTAQTAAGAFSIECFDATTGAPTLSIPLSPIGLPTNLVADGTTLYVMKVQQPGGLDAFSLPSGAAVFATTLSGAGGSNQDIIIAPAVQRAYMRGSNTWPTPSPAQVFVIDLTTGVELPAIPLGGTNHPTEWLLHGRYLYLLWQVYGGALQSAIQVIDTVTNLPVHPSPVVIPTYGNCATMRYGPGQNGDVIYLNALNAQPPLAHLIQLDPGTLIVVNQIPGAPQLINDMQLSAGGTEWLIVGTNTPFFSQTGETLFTLQIPSMTLSTVTHFPAFLQPTPLLAVVPSPTIRRAVAGLYNTTLPFTTDATTAPLGSVISLPFQPGGGFGFVLID